MVVGIRAVRSWSHANNVLRYAKDSRHERHEGATITAWQRYEMGKLSPQDMMRRRRAQLAAGRERIRRGRPREILAIHAYVQPPYRLPADQALSNKERAWVQDRAHELIGGPMAVCWHVKPRRPWPRMDAHFLVFAEFSRKQSPLYFLREVFDQIHDELNDQREKEGRPRLPTVEDARKAKGRPALARQLAAGGPLKVADLAGRLAKLGYRLGPAGIDEKADKVEVIFPDSDFGFGYRLSRLLEQVARLQPSIPATKLPVSEPDGDSMEIDL